MTITEDTPISALMNYEKVSSLCSSFTSKVDSFKQTAAAVIESEMSAGLSGENCLVAGNPLLEDEGSKTLKSISNIDTGITSKVVEKAKQKRMEELTTLRLKVIMKIQFLTSIKRQLQNKSEPDPSDASRIANLQKEIEKYEKKLDEVNAEYGRLR